MRASTRLAKRAAPVAATAPSIVSKRAAWIFALALPLVAWSAPARADDEAVARFERAVELYEAENYEGALVEFNTVYAITKTYKLLYNIGICQNAIEDYAAAAESFSRYLAEGGAALSEARRKDVQDRLAKLSLMVTRVRVTTDAPDGSTLLIDQKPAGTTPLAETIPVKIGRRVFTISGQGKTTTKIVDVVSGDQLAVVSLPIPDTVPPPAKTRDTASEDARTADTVGPSFPWPVWSLTAALGGVAAVTGTMAVSARNDLEEKQATFGIDRRSLEDAQSKAQTLGLVTDVLLATTVVSAGVSTYLTIRFFGAKKKSSARTALMGVTIAPTGIGYTRSF